MKLLTTTAAVLLAAITASAAIITEPIRTYSVGYDLADLQDPPVFFLQTIGDSAILSLTDVQVGLHLVGTTEGSGFAGDMFVSLTKDLSLTSILLNRVGVTGPSGPASVGFSYDGWDVSFRDTAVNGDIHPASLVFGDLTGAWQPDGRVSPTDTARPALLDIFAGSGGNGAWQLNVADLGLDSTMRLESWSLTLIGENGEAGVAEAPEPSTYAAGVALLGMAGAAWWRARRRQSC
jgi:MYXO-CTERM domain-containing protein